MSKTKPRFLSALGPVLLVGLFLSTAPRLKAELSQDPQETSENTKKNLPTNHHDANRAEQQSNSSPDVELTRKIRQSLTQDKSLSTFAHNVKIITRNGVVKLKGPGASKVKNELTVKAEK
jgi:osmotically-inducible protein OsmY